jgi:hypothetical protein
MKPPFPLLAIALLGVAVGACGGAKPGSGAGPKPVAATAPSNVSGAGSLSGPSLPHYPGVKQYPGDMDGDNDRDSDEGMRTAGYEASPSDHRAIAAAVKRYYAIAVARDGKRACAMLVPSLAKAVPIDYGRYGAPYLHGKHCAPIMSKLFTHLRRLVLAVANTMKLIDVRLEGDHGYAALHVNAPCLREACVLNTRKLNLVNLLFKREGKSWKIASLLAIV